MPVGAHNPVRIDCRHCGGQVHADGKAIGTRDAYEYCPLCGAEDIDVAIRTVDGD